MNKIHDKLRVGSLYRFVDEHGQNVPFSGGWFDRKNQVFRAGGNERGVVVPLGQAVLLVGFSYNSFHSSQTIPIFLTGESLACCSENWFRQWFEPIYPKAENKFSITGISESF